MEKFKNFINSLKEQSTMTKGEMTLLVLIGSLLGIIIGMLISPRKNMTIGCNNGNSPYTDLGNGAWDDDDIWDEDELWDEEEE